MPPWLVSVGAERGRGFGGSNLEEAGDLSLVGAVASRRSTRATIINIEIGYSAVAITAVTESRNLQYNTRAGAVQQVIE